MSRLDAYLQLAVQKHASDVHFSSGMPVSLRIDGDLARVEEKPHDAAALQQLLFEILDENERQKFLDHKNLDKSYRVAGLGNFRVNIFLGYNGIAAVFRWIPAKVPSMEEVGLPASLIPVVEAGKGMVLVTGPTGSGKSTTLASMIDYLNRTHPHHILTVEDPIEFVHVSQKSLVSQREIGSHCASFSDALKYSLREDPDVILVGEMRDLETIALAMTAAETGHLVFGTLHTRGAAASVDRIIDSFPANQQAMIRTMLAESLRAVVSQSLLKRADGQGRVAAFEILIANHAVSNLIREGKTFQIGTVMQTGRNLGMQLMDHHILELIRQGVVKSEDAEAYISDSTMLPNRPKRPVATNNLGASAKPTPYGRGGQATAGAPPGAPPMAGGRPGAPPPMPGGGIPNPGVPRPAVPKSAPPMSAPQPSMPRAAKKAPTAPPVPPVKVPPPVGGLPPTTPMPPTPAQIPDELFVDDDEPDAADSAVLPDSFDLDASGADDASDFEVTGLEELPTGDIHIPENEESDEEPAFRSIPQPPSAAPPPPAFDDSGDDFDIGNDSPPPPSVLNSYESEAADSPETSVPDFSQMPGMGGNAPPPPGSAPSAPKAPPRPAPPTPQAAPRPAPAPPIPQAPASSSDDEDEHESTVLADHRMGLPPPPGSLFKKKKSG